MNKLKIFLINAIILTSSSFILRLVSTFFSIYLSNKVSTETLGIFQLVMSVYTFGITLASSGINLATTRIVSEELEKGNKYSVQKATSRCLLLSICVSLFASFIFCINSDLIVKSFIRNKISKNVIYMISLALPLISICSCLNGYFTAVRKAYKNAIRTIY